MTILLYLQANESHFSPGQKKIARYILEDPKRIESLSSQQLANAIGVGQSSVIKFIQSLQFSGFTQFKLALASEVLTQQLQPSSSIHNAICLDDTLPTIAQKLLTEKQHALTQTTQSINFNQLSQAIECLIAARRVQIIGIGNSALAAKDLTYKLQKLGLSTLSETDMHIQLATATSLTDQDVMLVLSFSGRRKEIVLAAQTAKQRGATLIAITSLQQSPLRQLSDITFDTIADENRARSSSISSRTAQNTITDLLFMGVVQSMGEEAESQIKLSAATIEKLMTAN